MSRQRAALLALLAAACLLPAMGRAAEAELPRTLPQPAAPTRVTDSSAVPPTQPGRPGDIRRLDLSVSGPGWTRADFIRLGLDSKPGRPFDARVLERDLRRMGNYEIFQEIVAVTEATDEGVDIRIDAVDRWGLIPLFRPQFGGGIINVMGGIRDLNFLGFNQELGLYGGYYRSPESQSWLAGGWVIQRQFLGRHYLLSWAQRDYLVEPFYNGKTEAETELEKEILDLTLDFFWQRWDRFRPGAWVYLAERRFQPVGGAPRSPEDPEQLRGLRAGLQLKLGQVDYERFRYEGADLHLGAFHEFRTSAEHPFSGGFAVGRWFALPHDRVNLAVRGRLDLRNNTWRVDDIAWGGFDTVRGFPDRWIKGRRGALLNHELRLVAADQALGFGFVQVVGFYDVAWYGDTIGPGQREAVAQGVGGGIRLGVVQIHGTFLRVDVGWPLSHPELGPDISIGSSVQFF